MKKTVFISGKPSKLLENLARGYLRTGYNVAVTSPSTDEDSESEGLLRLNVNRRSQLSHRTALIDTLSRFEKIDEVIGIFAADVDKGFLHDFPTKDMEELIDESIKSVFFLLKETLTYFQKQQNGVLSLVLYSDDPSELPPLQAAAYGSFKSLASSLFSQYQHQPVSINGFVSHSSRPDEFAEFIRQTVEEKSDKSHGKWFKHSGRGGFLSNLSIPGKKK